MDNEKDFGDACAGLLALIAYLGCWNCRRSLSDTRLIVVEAAGMVIEVDKAGGSAARFATEVI